MSRRPGRFTQADVVRAIRAADRLGTGRVVDILPDGTIRIVPAQTILPDKALQTGGEPDGDNPWDR